MKVVIAYESKYGNGKKCVEYLQNTIRKKEHEIESFSVSEIKTTSLPQADLYIFSTPTHIGGPTRKMKKFLKKLKISEKGAKYALMTTCMDEKFYDKTKALQVMEDLLQPSGLTKVSDGIKIKVAGMKGPLEKDYEKKLDAFVKEIL